MGLVNHRDAPLREYRKSHPDFKDLASVVHAGERRGGNLPESRALGQAVQVKTVTRGGGGRSLRKTQWGLALRNKSAGEEVSGRGLADALDALKEITA